MLPPRPETAELRRRIEEACRRNGTDPAELPAIYERNQWLAVVERLWLRIAVQIELKPDPLMEELEGLACVYRSGMEGWR